MPRQTSRFGRLLLGLVVVGVAAPVAVVRAGSADHFAVSAAGPLTAGGPATVTVEARDNAEAVDTTYAGTVTLTSTDGSAELPADYTFQPGDGGTHDLLVTLKTAGPQTITATDGPITGTSGSLDIGPSSAATLDVSGFPSPMAAGVASTVRVTARDAYGNVATGYGGTVHLASSPVGATLPADHDFGGDHGDFTFTGIAFPTPGSWTLTATDAVNGIHGTRTGIAITDTAPTCAPPGFSGPEDAPISDTVGGACTDPDAGPALLSYIVTAPPSHGTLTAFDGSTGAFTYTPDADSFGPDAFTVDVSDGSAATPLAVSLTVDPVNDPPSFVAGPGQSVLEDTPGPITVNAWAGSRSPGPGESEQALDFLVTNDANGLFAVQPTIAPDGVLTYTLAPDANGSATVTARLHDDGGTAGGGVDTSAPQVFTISVSAVNDGPAFSVGPDQTLGEQSSLNPQVVPGWAAGMSAGPTNESGQGLSFTVSTNLPRLFSSPAPSVDPTTGTLTFTPAPNRNGVATVTVTLHDDGGTAVGGVATASHTFTITISGVDHPPFALSDLFTVVAGSPATALAVLANDDANNLDQGEILTIVGVTRPAHGIVRVASGGRGLTYQPAAGFHGTDWFDYVIRDPGGQTARATVLVSVPRDTYRPVATPPVQGIPTSQKLGSSTAIVRLAWSATDRGGGVTRYELWQSRNGGAYARVHLASSRSRSISLALTLKAAYRFRVRAVDRAGNVGSFAYGPTFRVAATPETPSSSLTYAGTWRAATGPAYLGGRERASSVALDTATYAFTGRNIAWITTRATTRGVATILVDGLVAATVDTRSAVSAYRRVVWTRSFGSLGAHTVTIRVVGTPGRPRIDLDGFVAIR